jgi:hypothetical protein
MDAEYKQQPLLFARQGKRFNRTKPEDGGQWLAQKHRDRAAAWGDLDNDGDIDVIVSELNGPIRVLRNDVNGLSDATDGRKSMAASPNWLIVSLRDERPESKNRRGIGSVIELESRGARQPRWLYSGGSFQSSSAPYVHFGIPHATDAVSTNQITLTVTWFDGTKQQINDVAPGQHVTVSRP